MRPTDNYTITILPTNTVDNGLSIALLAAWNRMTPAEREAAREEADREAAWEV